MGLSRRQNSKFFFRMLQQRKAKNKIWQLTLVDGEVCTDQSKIKEAILDHLKKILGTARQITRIFNSNGFQDMGAPGSTYKALCKMAATKEIREALWSIKDDKRPSLDGYNSFFF